MICVLCDSQARLAHAGLPGYREGDRFDIYDCPRCVSQFAWPLATDDTLYESIYENARAVPGYARYQAYAEEVRNTASPLDLLAAKEESYWATAEMLRGMRRAAGRNLRVLDVGSGLGYLTYALRKDGFDAVGVDSSGRAVSRALRLFGPFYKNAMLDWLVGSGERYDAILMNQMLEHVPDPKAMLTDAGCLLNSSGALIITTPNRSFAPAGAVWETDLPPVHCWWFSEETFSFLSGILDCGLALFDFSGYYASHYVRFDVGMIPPLNRKKPFLGIDGSPLPGIWARPGDWPLERAASHLGLQRPYRALRDRLTRVRRLSGARGPVCCAVLTRH